MRKSSWLSDIEGLRAVAVLGVVLFHFGVPGVVGGFAGVDVFFVISGFLITAEIARGDFNLRDFYVRRIRRLGPALYFSLAITSVAAFAIFTPENLSRFGRALVSAAMFVSNFLVAKESRYFDPHALQRPLLHTWSLGVEAEFYLAWPALLLWLRGRRVGIVRAIGVCCVVSFACALIFASGKGSYYSAPLRFWEFGIGGLAACPPFVARRWSRWATWLSWVGLLAVLDSFAVLRGHDSAPGVFALAPCVGAFLVIVGARARPEGANPLLSAAAVRWIGRLSYPIYLWHWPVLVFYTYLFFQVPPFSHRLILLLIVVALSMVTQFIVEAPAKRAPGAAIVWFTGLSAGALALLGLVTAVPGFILGRSQAPLRAESYNEGVCFLAKQQKASQWSPDLCGFSVGPKRPTQRVLLWGDSHAAHFAPGLVDGGGGTESYILTEAAYSACLPLTTAWPTGSKDDCGAFNERVLGWVAANPPDLVILSASWLSDLERISPGAPSTILVPHLRTLLATLRRSGVKQVLVLGQTPTYEVDAPQIVFALGLRGMTPRARPSSSGGVDALLQRVAQSESADFFAPSAVLCNSVDCALEDGLGHVLQWDSGHLSLEGSKFMARHLDPQITRLLRRVGPSATSNAALGV